jgi:hypothetical protein
MNQVLRRGSRGDCVKVVQQAVGACSFIFTAVSLHSLTIFFKQTIKFYV